MLLKALMDANTTCQQLTICPPATHHTVSHRGCDPTDCAAAPAPCRSRQYAYVKSIPATNRPHYHLQQHLLDCPLASEAQAPTEHTLLLVLVYAT
jgi:hypothetical protein